MYRVPLLTYATWCRWRSARCTGPTPARPPPGWPNSQGRRRETPRPGWPVCRRPGGERPGGGPEAAHRRPATGGEHQPRARPVPGRVAGRPQAGRVGHVTL